MANMIARLDGADRKIALDQAAVGSANFRAIVSKRGNGPFPPEADSPVPELAAGKSLFSTAFDAARNAMVVIGEDRRFVDLHEAALVALGYRRDELVDRKFDDVVAASDREAV